MFKILSLEQQSLVKVADVLWNEEGMDRVLTECRPCYIDESAIERFISEESMDRVLTERRPGYYDESAIERIIDEVMGNIFIAKVSNLFVPCIIREKLLYIIKKVGLQRINWYFYHEKQWMIRRLPRMFYRTSWGTIDRKRTAESLVMDDTVKIGQRYLLACCYCFEKEIYKFSIEFPWLIEHYVFKPFGTFEDAGIIKFWSLLTEYERLEFDHRNRTNLTDVQQEARDHCLAEINVKKKKVYTEAFRFALETCNNVATEYFHGMVLKIEPRDAEKLDNLLESVFHTHINEPFDDFCIHRPLEYCIDATFFQLRQMTKDKQIKALRSDRTRSIALYLRWPFQSLFSHYVKTFFCPMPQFSLVCVLDAIIRSSERHMYKVFNYEDPFTHFWHEISVSQKLGVINHLLRNYYILSSLIIDGYSEVFVILSSLTSTRKKKFLLSKHGMELCKHIAEREAWNSLKLLFEATLSSRILVAKFKIKLKSFLAEKKYINIAKILDILSECKSNLRALSH